MAEAVANAAAAAAAVETQEASLLDQIVEQGRFGEAKERGKDLVKEFVAQVLEGSMTIAKDAEMMINARIAQIDHLLSIQLNEIMHHPSFQKLEGSWRGLKYLMDNSETGVGLKIRVFNASKKELLRDIEKAPEFDQSALFKKIYEEEYGVFGGAPFGALVGDYEFGKHPEDMALLEGVSHIAAQAHAPFVSAAAPDLFNLESYTALDAPRDLAKIFDSTEYAKWKSFRQSEDSRYVALTLPRTLGRLPYGADTKPIDEFRYEEHVDGTDHSKYLWMNASYALGVEDDAVVCALWHVRGHARRGGRRPGGRPADPYLRHRRRRPGAQVPNGSSHHRSPREGTRRPGLCSTGALQGHGLRGVLQRAKLPEAQGLRHGFGQCQRAPLHAAPVHHGGVPLCPLPEGHDARQDRQLYVA